MMIIWADHIRLIDFSKLTDIYADDVESSRKRYYSEVYEFEGRRLAEQDYYQYLREQFFGYYGGKMCILEEGGRYLSVVCFEPYNDGFLLHSLITAPDMRRKGLARKLIFYGLERLGEASVYAHIYRKNVASQKLHDQLGFVHLYDYAHMLDDSVRSDHITYIRKK